MDQLSRGKVGGHIGVGNIFDKWVVFAFLSLLLNMCANEVVSTNRWNLQGTTIKAEPSLSN